MRITCTSCGTLRHVPREMCAECNSFEWEWVRSTGRGTVYTWVVVNRALHPAFAHDGPYAVVVVELVKEGRAVGPLDQLGQTADAPFIFFGAWSDSFW